MIPKGAYRTMSNICFLRCFIVDVSLDPEYAEAAPRGVLWKKVFLKILQNSQENTRVRTFILMNLQALDDCF